MYFSSVDDKTIFYGLEDSDLLKSGETPQFQWLRDGQPFQPEDRFKVDYKVGRGQKKKKIEGKNLCFCCFNSGSRLDSFPRRLLQLKFQKCGNLD